MSGRGTRFSPRFAGEPRQVSPIHRPLTIASCSEPLPPTTPSATADDHVINPVPLHAKPSHDGDWANIPDDLVSDIAKKISVADYIRLAAACKSWFRALRPYPTLQKKPYLMTFAPNSNYLLDVTNNLTHVIDSPPQITGKWCAGSQRGRLVLLDEFSNITVLNPLTGSYIRLPEITTIPGVTPVYDPKDPSQLVAYDYREFGDSYENKISLKIAKFRKVGGMKKVVFSHDFTVAVAIFGLHQDILAYLRPGDCNWTTINTRLWEETHYGSIQDIICRPGADDRDGCCFLVVFLGGPTFFLDITAPSVEFTPIAIGGDLRIPYFSYADRYLVDISGEIMQVARRFDNRKGLTVGFCIWRLDYLNSTWTLVDNLGDYSLFVGIGYSTPFLTTAGGAFGFRSNCIYFSDVFHRLFRYPDTEDMGVYSVNDASFERITLRDHKLMWSLPAWIVPFGS